MDFEWHDDQLEGTTMRAIFHYQGQALEAMANEDGVLQSIRPVDMPDVEITPDKEMLCLANSALNAKVK